MKQLRKEVGSKKIGVNFDPSHLFWQGIDPVAAINDLGDMIYHFHAKDTFFNKENISKNGTLDTGDYTNLKDRSWYFCSVCYGHDQVLLKQIITTLRVNGYDGIISIEHEHIIMSVDEGVEKAIKILGEIVLKENYDKTWRF